MCSCSLKEGAKSYEDRTALVYSKAALQLLDRPRAHWHGIQNLLRKQREEGVPAQKDNRKTLNDFIKSINEADQNNDLIVDIAAGQGAPNAAMQSGGGFASMLEGSPMKQNYNEFYC